MDSWKKWQVFFFKLVMLFKISPIIRRLIWWEISHRIHSFILLRLWIRLKLSVWFFTYFSDAFTWKSINFCIRNTWFLIKKQVVFEFFLQCHFPKFFFNLGLVLFCYTQKVSLGILGFFLNLGGWVYDQWLLLKGKAIVMSVLATADRIFTTFFLFISFKFIIHHLQAFIFNFLNFLCAFLNNRITALSKYF